MMDQESRLEYQEYVKKYEIREKTGEIFSSIPIEHIHFATFLNERFGKNSDDMIGLCESEDEYRRAIQRRTLNISMDRSERDIGIDGRNGRSISIGHYHRCINIMFDRLLAVPTVEGVNILVQNDKGSSAKIPIITSEIQRVWMPSLFFTHGELLKLEEEEYFVR